MKCGVLQKITMICHTCTKEFQIQSLSKQLLTIYQIFMKLPQILHTHKNRKLLRHYWKLTDQLLLPYKFYSTGMSGIHFFNFTSCEPLKLANKINRAME